MIGFWPANAVGDDIIVYADDSRDASIATLHTLRQQLEKREGRANAALADFIAPRGVPDYIGAFVVTAGIGEDVIADKFKNANDDYSSILFKALADRLAEAFAERMHARVRTRILGLRAGRDADARRPDRWRSIRASARRRAIRRSPITPRRRRCSRCSTPRSMPA